MHQPLRLSSHVNLPQGLHRMSCLTPIILYDRSTFPAHNCKASRSVRFVALEHHASCCNLSVQPCGLCTWTLGSYCCCTAMCQAAWCSSPVRNSWSCLVPANGYALQVAVRCSSAGQWCSDSTLPLAARGNKTAVQAYYGVVMNDWCAGEVTSFVTTFQSLSVRRCSFPILFWIASYT